MKKNIADQIVAKVAALLRRNHKKAAHEAALDLSRQYGGTAANYMKAAKEEAAYFAYTSSWKEVENTRKKFRADEFREELVKDATAQRRRLDKKTGGVMPSEINWKHAAIALRAAFEDAEKCRRVLIAAIEGVAVLVAFVNGGCRALVTKMAKTSFSFNLQRFAEDKKTVEVDVNSADAVLLSKVDGFGSQTVSAIISERTINGMFKDADDFVDRIILSNGHHINWTKAQSGDYVPVIKEVKVADDFEVNLLGIIKAGNHELDSDIRRTLMNKGLYSTVKMQSYEAVVNKNSRVCVLFNQDIVGQPASMFTEQYAEKNVRLYDSIKHPVAVKYGTDKLATFNNSSLVSLNEDSKNEAVKEAINFRNSLMNGEISLVMADVKKDNERIRRHLLLNIGHDEYISLTHLVRRVDSFGKTIDNETVRESEIIDKLAVFNSELIVYSTSQARQDNFMAFNDIDDDARKMAALIFNDATFGQYDMRAGEKIPAAMAVDLTTRLSSHTCGLGMRNATVQSFCVLTCKDSQLDGEGAADQTQIARMLAKDDEEHVDLKKFQYFLEKVHGLQIQVRPYTAKATAHVYGDHYVSRMLRNMNLYKVYVTDNGRDIVEAESGKNVTKFFNQNFRHLLVKGQAKKSAFMSYDGVVVYSSKKEMNYCSIPTVIGDRNFWKDVFDVRKNSGLNVVMVPHSDNEDLGTWTAAQFWKVARYAAVQAGAEDEFDKIAREYAYRGIDFGVNFVPDHEVRYGFEKVDTSFTEGLLRNLNAGEETLHPTLFRGLVSDAVRRIEKMIQLDRYPVAGHVGMFDVDPAYALLRAADKTEKEAMKNGILKIENNVMEVYDPFANKFFDREGIEEADRMGTLMKYPAINLFESSFVRFLSDEEIVSRIMSLDLDEEDKIALIEEIAAVKEGSVLLPANLRMIGMILAGSDRDGDKGSFFFRTGWEHDIVAAMQRWGFQSQGVDIHIDSEPCGAKVEAGIASFAVVNAMQAALHNEKVGPVTNASRVLVQPALYGTQNISDDIKKCLVEAFKVCFSPKGEGVKAEYSSPYEVKVEDGFTIVESLENQYKRFEAAVAKLNFNRADIWDQIIRVAKDFGNLGRHTQEGTIDAAKKFYKVVADFVARLRQVLTTTPIRYGVKFEINWKSDVLECTLRADKYSKNVCSVMYKDHDVEDDPDFHGILADDVVSIYTDNGNGNVSVKNIIPDFFAGVRRDAISYALDQLNALVDTYEDMLTNKELISLWADRAVKAAAAIKKPQQELIRYALGMVDVIRVNYRAMSDALTKRYIDRESMSDMEIAKVDSQIRRVLHENFDDMMSAVNNMIRIAGNGVSAETLVDFVAGGAEAFTNPSSRYAGVLKEETAKVAIARSKNNLAYKKLYGDLDASVTSVKIANREVYVGDKMVGIRVNVEDGMYDVAHLDDGTFITRPLTNFVEIPKADIGHVSVMPYLGGYDENGVISNETFANNIGIIDAVSNCNEPVIITTRRNEKGFEQMCLATEKGAVICDLYQGRNNGAKYAMKNHFNGFVGHVENVLYPDNRHLSSAVIILKKDEKASEKKKAAAEAAKKNEAMVSAEDMKNFKF